MLCLAQRIRESKQTTAIRESRISIRRFARVCTKSPQSQSKRQPGKEVWHTTVVDSHNPQNPVTEGDERNSDLTPNDGIGLQSLKSVQGIIGQS